MIAIETILFTINCFGRKWYAVYKFGEIRGYITILETTKLKPKLSKNDYEYTILRIRNTNIRWNFESVPQLLLVSR